MFLMLCQLYEGRDHAWLFFDMFLASSTVPDIQQFLNKYLLQEGSAALGQNELGSSLSQFA